MGNEQKKSKAPAPKVPTPAEIKTYIMVIQGKINLYRNKRIESIRKKKKEIEKSLRENNLDVAKAKMDSIIREEDMMTVYDILTPLCEILKERVTYIITSSECPPDLRAQLDSVMYASTRVEISEFQVLRDLILRKYGTNYLQKADQNVDRLVNVNLVEKLKIKPASDVFLTIRLKQFCKEKKIPFEFPEVYEGDFNNNNGGNPYSQGNPFDMQGQNNYNPYASNYGPQNNNPNNPYGQQWNNNGPSNNQYGPPMNNNFNPYASTQNNNNPYSPPPNQNQFNQQPPQNYNNNNNYGPPQGQSQFNQPPPNNTNPYGPPPNQSQFNNQSKNYNNNNNNNPYGSPQNQSQFNQSQNNNNPYDPSNNKSQFNQSQNNNPNPYDPSNNKSQFNQSQKNNNPYAPPPGQSQFNQSQNNNPNPNPFEPPSNQSQKPNNNSQFNQSLNNINNNPFDIPTIDTIIKEQPPSNNSQMNQSQNNNPFSQPPGNSQFGQQPPMNNNSMNPYGSIQNNNSQMGKSNLNNNNNNPYSGQNETPMDNKSNMYDTNYTSSALRSKPKQSQNKNTEKKDDEGNDNPYLEKSNNNNNINESKVNNNENNNMKNSQSNLFCEMTEIEKDKSENPYNNDNVEMNNPFGEGFNKSIAQSITNPYADNINNNNNNVNIEVQKSQNNVNNSMQGSIVDDVKFKDNIPSFDDATNDFPKSD